MSISGAAARCAVFDTLRARACAACYATHPTTPISTAKTKMTWMTPTFTTTTTWTTTMTPRRCSSIFTIWRRRIMRFLLYSQRTGLRRILRYAAHNFYLDGTDDDDLYDADVDGEYDELDNVDCATSFLATPALRWTCRCVRATAAERVRSSWKTSSTSTRTSRAKWAACITQSFAEAVSIPRTSQAKLNSCRRASHRGSDAVTLPTLGIRKLSTL